MSSKNKSFIIIALSIVVVVLFYSNVYISNKLRDSSNANLLFFKELETNYTPDTDILCYGKKVSEVITNYQKSKDIFIDSINNKTPLLFYRYSQFICDGCVQDDLDLLDSLVAKIGKEHILVLPAFPNNKENRLRLRNRLAKFNFINIPIEDFDIPLECNSNLQKRYFAYINKDRIIEFVFFPEREKPQLTKHFFSEIKEKLKAE